MNDFTSTPATGAPLADAGGPPPTIESLMEKLSDPALPSAGRKPLLAQLEAIHKARAGAASGETSADTEVAEALAPPTSPVGYHLETHLPAGVEIVDAAAAGALKSSLHELGVPASVAAAAMGQIGELFRDGAFATDQSITDAATIARNQVYRVHGEAAPAMLRDAAAFIDDAVISGKLTHEQADAICCSPLAVAHAAMLARHGASRK